MPSTKIIRFVQLGRPRRYLLVEAVAVLAACSVAVRFLPFRWAVRMGSRKLPRKGPSDRGEVVRDARWSIGTAAATAPWRAVCLQRGLALQWMLRRRGIDALLHYGLAREKAGGLKAHAWVAVGNELVIGGEIASEFRCVAIFPDAEGVATTP